MNDDDDSYGSQVDLVDLGKGMMYRKRGKFPWA